MGKKHSHKHNQNQTLQFGLGWQPDVPDWRDMMFMPKPLILASLPASVNLQDKCPKVYNQGQLGSCTANSIGGNIEFLRMKQGLEDWVPSRLFIYYNERLMEGTVGSDAGAQIRDGIKCVNTQGACKESSWTYDITKFSMQPSNDAYSEGKLHEALSYQRITNNLNDMKACLAGGYPFVLGFAVYESMMSQEVADSGIVPMPQKSEKAIGGHAVLCVGYSENDKRFRVRNSWGSGWGQEGYFEIDYAYFTNENLCDDRWSLRLVQ